MVRLYDALVEVAPTVGAQTGRAAAASEAEGASAGLRALDAVDGDRVQSYQPYWAVRADLLAKLGRVAEADAAYQRSIGLTEDPAARAFLKAKRTVLS